MRIRHAALKCTAIAIAIHLAATGCSSGNSTFAHNPLTGRWEQTERECPPEAIQSKESGRWEMQQKLCAEGLRELAERPKTNLYNWPTPEPRSGRLVAVDSLQEAVPYPVHENADEVLEPLSPNALEPLAPVIAAADPVDAATAMQSAPIAPVSDQEIKSLAAAETIALSEQSSAQPVTSRASQPLSRPVAAPAAVAPIIAATATTQVGQPAAAQAQESVATTTAAQESASRKPELPALINEPPSAAVAGTEYRFEPVVAATEMHKSVMDLRGPAWLALNDKGLVGVPTVKDAGKNDFLLVIRGPEGEVTKSFSVIVEHQDQPPFITAPARVVARVGSAIAIPVSATDPEGNDVSMDAELPAWMTLDKGMLSGTPARTDVGKHRGSITGSDGALASTSNFDVAVYDMNFGPSLDVPQAITITEGTELSLQVTASDAEGDAVTISADGMPPWMSLNSGMVTGTPSRGDVGTHNISVKAADRRNQTVQQVAVTVAKGNDIPTLQVVDASKVSLAKLKQPVSPAISYTIGDGEQLMLTISASDPDKQSVQFGFDVPAWVEVGDRLEQEDGSTSVRLTAAPSRNDVGQHSLVVRASDGTGEKATTIDLTVNRNPERIWHIAAGERIDEALQRWAQQATDDAGQDWTVAWKHSKTWKCPAKATYVGTFESALVALLSDIKAQGGDINIEIYEGNLYAEVKGHVQ